MNRFEVPPLPGEQPTGAQPGQQAPGAQSPGGVAGSTGGVEPANPYAAPGAFAPAPPAPWGLPAAAMHPQGTPVLVLGILGLIVPPLSPVAWILGAVALRQVDRSGQQVANRSSLVAGMVLGIIGTALLALGVVGVVMFLYLFALNV